MAEVSQNGLNYLKNMLSSEIRWRLEAALKEESGKDWIHLRIETGVTSDDRSLKSLVKQGLVVEKGWRNNRLTDEGRALAQELYGQELEEKYAVAVNDWRLGQEWLETMYEDMEAEFGRFSHDIKYGEMVYRMSMGYFDIIIYTASRTPEFRMRHGAEKLNDETLAFLADAKARAEQIHAIITEWLKNR